MMTLDVGLEEHFQSPFIVNSHLTHSSVESDPPSFAWTPTQNSQRSGGRTPADTSTMTSTLFVSTDARTVESSAILIQSSASPGALHWPPST
jgi:hypothetical protein